MNMRLLTLAIEAIATVSGFALAASEATGVSVALPVVVGLVPAAISKITGRADAEHPQGRGETMRARL